MDLHFRIQTPEGKAEPATFPSELSVQQLISEFVTDENMRIQPADPALWYLLDENTFATTLTADLEFIDACRV